MTTLSEIEQLAEKTSMDAGVFGIFPVPLEMIAAFLNFATLSFHGSPDISGAIKYSDRVIYVNNDEPVHRQRFTLAHEIGHAVMHGGQDIMDYRVTMDSPNDRKEVEANRFAADLLMPRAYFTEVWNSRAGNTVRVAAFFGVSTQAAGYRARNLGHY